MDKNIRIVENDKEISATANSIKKIKLDRKIDNKELEKIILRVKNDNS